MVDAYTTMDDRTCQNERIWHLIIDRKRPIYAFSDLSSSPKKFRGTIRHGTSSIELGTQDQKVIGRCSTVICTAKSLAYIADRYTNG